MHDIQKQHTAEEETYVCVRSSSVPGHDFGHDALHGVGARAVEGAVLEVHEWAHGERRRCQGPRRGQPPAGTNLFLRPGGVRLRPKGGRGGGYAPGGPKIGVNKGGCQRPQWGQPPAGTRHLLGDRRRRGGASLSPVTFHW